MVRFSTRSGVSGNRGAVPASRGTVAYSGSSSPTSGMEAYWAS
jgi:hypothetical protein